MNKEKILATAGDLAINIACLPFMLIMGGRPTSPLMDAIKRKEREEERRLFNVECMKYLNIIYPEHTFNNVIGHNTYIDTGEDLIRIKANVNDGKKCYLQVKGQEFYDKIK